MEILVYGWQWYHDLGLEIGHDVADIRAGRIRERTDEIGELVSALTTSVLMLKGPKARLTLPGKTVVAIIKALERVPLPRGNSRALGPFAKSMEGIARDAALQLQKKKEAEGLSKLDAQAHAAKEAVPIFKRLGRTLKSGTIKRIMQGKRSKRPRKLRR